LRIVFATLVLLSHAPEITDGNASRELFHRFTGSPMTFGTLGVDGFFILSGYLIVQSWLGDPELINFLRKRVLRIVPGYLVAVVFRRWGCLLPESIISSVGSAYISSTVSFFSAHP
jgi:peptidoglycan/LPS O-acetylase OafA/YrhL